jgi:serine/threonine-protein kinase HipA
MATVRRVRACTVRLRGEDIGAAAWNEAQGFASFEYTGAFVRRGLQLAPLTMPVEAGRTYSFPALNRETFLGLPGLLADALPDRFGNALIDIWLAEQGRSKADFNPVERLCYMGARGMGALEFKPAHGPRARTAVPIEIDELTRIAAQVLKQREALITNLDAEQEEALKMIIRIGTSAGGARPKAVIAWNPETGEVRSGQVAPPPGFQPWLLKFDGASEESLGDPQGYGRIEYAYYHMAAAAGIIMTECRLFEEQGSGRAHFMTRRFDRGADGEKVHVQSLCAMNHFDYNAVGQYSYEQALDVIRQLRLGHPALELMFRRMVFNVLARNQDDHTRNIEFLMDAAGKWSLAPAYDMTWSHRSDSPWVSRHQMRINGKTDHFDGSDLLAVADAFGIRKAADITADVAAAVARWPQFARDAGVEASMIETIAHTHRLALADQVT